MLCHTGCLPAQNHNALQASRPTQASTNSRKGSIHVKEFHETGLWILIMALAYLEAPGSYERHNLGKPAPQAYIYMARAPLSGLEKRKGRSRQTNSHRGYKLLTLSEHIADTPASLCQIDQFQSCHFFPVNQLCCGPLPEFLHAVVEITLSHSLWPSEHLFS